MKWQIGEGGGRKGSGTGSHTGPPARGPGPVQVAIQLDKDAIACPLAVALQAKGLQVSCDEFSLTVGDSLRQSIDEGLAHSRFGIVILSKNFFEKHWPEEELNGLATREVEGKTGARGAHSQQRLATAHYAEPYLLSHRSKVGRVACSGTHVRSKLHTSYRGGDRSCQTERRPVPYGLMFRCSTRFGHVDVKAASVPSPDDEPGAAPYTD